MYLATKYASQVLNISIDALKKSAQRGNNYPFIKFQNKLLFKVTNSQLSIALNKGLISADTPVYNDDLTLIQDFFKMNLTRRVNGRERNKRTSSDTSSKHTPNDDFKQSKISDGLGAGLEQCKVFGGKCDDTSGINAGKYHRQRLSVCTQEDGANKISTTRPKQGARIKLGKSKSTQQNNKSSGDTTRANDITTKSMQGAVDDNTTNYNANNQCDNKSLLSNENNKNEIKDSITSARANKTMSQKYKNETTNSEIYEQINKQRIENDDRKNPQDLSHSKADERLSRANRNSQKAEISKATDDVCKNDRGYRCEDDGTRKIGLRVSKALSTTNESKKYPSISTSQTNESSTLNECLNERESFLLENNLSHTHASLSTFLKANAKSQEIALARVHVVKEYLKLKGKIKVSEFIDLINARSILKLSQRKLFLWQKAYLNGGLDALIPQYKNTKKTTLEELGLKEFFENALISEKGRINLANVYKLVHYEASARNLISLDDFLAKKDELVSYASIKRAANAFFKNNKLLKDLILYGEDGCTSRHLPALGVSNWAVNSINQIVEIDASPLDAICNTTDIATRLGIDAELVSSWQKRYCIISLIDTYSGVVSFYLGESENSQTIARAIAKYIKLYGKPKCIHSDNGKAFLSKHIKGMLERLDIEYKAMPAYSGWCKPYVENKFKALQNSLTANLSGYIGANVGQRQAIEFFMSKKERRLKKGMKTNLAKLKDLEYMQNIIDDFTNKFLNNTFLDRLQSTPNETYMKKQDEAICIDELSLSMYLGGSLEYRNVSSKGISLNGQIYQNPKLYNYESVYVCASLNNVSQIFCFDEQKELICVAVLIDPVVGVSVEEAKQARKLYIKALKQNKEKISKARDERERMFERYIELGKETLSTIVPNQTHINDRLLEELEYANMLVSGSDVSVKKSNVKSWEDFV